MRIIGEGTGTNHDILWIGVHISHGRKVDIKPVLGEVGADGVSTLIGILRVACRTDSTHRLVFLHQEIGVVANTGHTTAFLVDTQQWLTVQRFYLRYELCQLSLILDIMGIKDDTPYRIVLHGVFHAVIHGLE